MFKKEYAKVSQVAISDICPCPYQPRKTMSEASLVSLSQNIAENGILQPLTATKLSNGKYQLIAGHRRLLAADMAGLTSVPVVVLEKSDEEIAVLSVIENLQREDLNFFEQAMAIKTLMEKLSITQVQVGQKLSLSQPAIANKLRILQFSAEEQVQMTKRGLTERHARAIIRLPIEKRSLAINHIIKNDLNVSQTDKYVTSLLNKVPSKKRKVTIKLKDIRLFTNTITRRVKIMQSAGIKADYTKDETEKDITYFITVSKQTS